MTCGSTTPKKRVAKFVPAKLAPRREETAETGAGNGTQETTPCILTEDTRQAFQNLKKAFLEAPLLAHFNPEWKTRLETDASGYAVSGITSQLNPHDGQWHPIAFWSRKMTPAE